ncbi:MAG TPA: ferric reductase-like transmembrane domain-containing protein [Acidimicrobiales bacterium]|nr:ferric reductase-like transmembrane domain-containing protein [Acidimicrobiales bacterium]
MHPVTTTLAAASNGKALWYLTRSTGLVALVLLTATVVIGVVASVGWTTERWPRFLSQDVHRNLSLLCVGFVALHVVTTVSDGYVPIGFADAFIPFRTAYRPLWVGLGAMTFDLMVAVLVTSALRHRIGFATWRFVHWLAYLCWPIALVHGLGSGTDSSLAVVVAVNVLCAATVVTVVAWRLVTGRAFTVGQRTTGTAVTAIAVVGIVIFAAVGPLRPGWSRRAGTSTSVLAQLARKNAGVAASAPSATAPSTIPTTAPTGGLGTVPSPPFTNDLSGSQTTSPTARGDVRVTLGMRLNDPASTALTVVLNGTAVAGGGVEMSSDSVAFGPYQGVVTSLSGGTLLADVSSPTPMALTISLSVDQSSGALSGTVSGMSGSVSDGRAQG